jgi:predicted lipoprotein with Yx(FWY)xxD motif
MRFTLRTVLLVAVGLLVLAACSSSHKSTATNSTVSTSGPPSSSEVKIGSANVGNLGQVLVDAQGRTLYLLSSESAGKPLSCTAANGCTSAWPPVTLPSSAKAEANGSAQDSKLGTVTYGGVTYVTYAGYPLYRFAGDSGPGTADGEGIHSFGGTWYAVSVTGQPAMVTSGGSTSTSTSSSGYGGGY